MNQLTVSLWGDESFSAVMAQRSLWDIIHITSQDTSPPLYYLLLHFWVKLFGISEIALRSFSMMLFILFVGVVYFLTKHLFDKQKALFATILTLVNPILFQYAFEVRMYMLFILSMTLSMWFFYTKRWGWYIGSTLIALYSHYFSFFMIGTQILCYCLLEIDKAWKEKEAMKGFLKKQIVSPFFFSIIVIILGYLPWLSFFLTQTKNVAGDFWLGRPTSLADLWVLYAHFIAGATNLGIQSYVVGISIFLLVVRQAKKERDLLLYLWLFFPPLFTFFYSFIGRPIFFDRYLIVCIVPIPILLASAYKTQIGILKKNGYYFITLLLLFVITSLIYITSYVFSHPNKQPFRELSQYSIGHYGKSTQIINYYTNYLHYFELKYNGVNVKVYSVHPLPFWVGKALINPSDILTSIPNDQKLIIMASGDIKQIMLPAYHIIQQHWFHNLYLFVYEKN